MQNLSNFHSCPWPHRNPKFYAIKMISTCLDHYRRVLKSWTYIQDNSMDKFLLSFVHGVSKTYYNIGPSAYSTDFPKSQLFSALANFDLQNMQINIKSIYRK